MTREKLLELCDYLECNDASLEAQCEAAAFIRKALAQPEQEPVAWGNLANWCLDSDRVLITDKDEAAKYHKDVYDLTPLYTTPPQRTWVGLTDEEIDELHGSPMNLEHSGALKWVRTIEAKLKEKNND